MRRPGLGTLVLAALVAVPMLFTAVALSSELTVAVPTTNDGNNHLLFVRRADDALSRGEHVLDHWVPEMELGFPEFFYYQHLPHLVVVALGRITFGSVDLFTLFNLVRYLLLAGLPLTVYWSMRRIGFDGPQAAFGAAASPLLSAGFMFGLEYDSYVWLGYGMYTQLWAMHLAFVALACIHRALSTGRGHAAAIVALAALALSHLAYAYMLAITAVALAPFLGRARDLPKRVATLLLVGAATAVGSAYMAIPFVLEREYLEISPSLPRFRWDSFGAEQVLRWLVEGRLFDHGRLPVLTVLVGAGAAVAVTRRTRPALTALGLFGLWLVLYFGRPTLGAVADLLPLHEGLPMHRFIGMVQLAGILLIGLAGGTAWRLAAARFGAPGIALATMALVLLLVPAMQERQQLYAPNADLMTRTKAALDRDIEGRRVLDLLAGASPGRVYAGLRTNWGERFLNLGLPFRSLRFYDLLTFEQLEPVAPPYYSWSLNADLLFFFNEADAGHFDAFNVRHVVSGADVRLPSFLRALHTIGPYRVYEAPTTGYAEYVAIVERVGVPTQADLITRNVAWLAGDGPATRRYLRYDFPAAPSARTLDDPGCRAGTVREEGVAPGRFAFSAECATTATVVLKTTFHPGWQVTVDGEQVATFMVSPSFVGFEVPAGARAIVAEYRAHPSKTPLAILGLLVVVGSVILGRRLDRLVAAIGSSGMTLLREPPPQRDEEQEPREDEDKRLAQERADGRGDHREQEEREDPPAARPRG